MAKGSGGWTSPKENQVADDAPVAQLYDLESDIGEQSNRYLDQGKIAKQLLAYLEQDVNSGSSANRASSKNDTNEIELWKSGTQEQR